MAKVSMSYSESSYDFIFLCFLVDPQLFSAKQSTHHMTVTGYSVYNVDKASFREKEMRNTVLLLTFSLCIQSAALWAKDEPSTYKGPPTPSMVENVMPKKDWIAHINNSLPGLLCDHNQYFVQCFQVNAKECTEFTQLLVQACLNNVALALPPELDPQQGEYWGQIVGRCSYDLYEKFMHEKKRDLPNCNKIEKNDTPKPSQAIP